MSLAGRLEDLGLADIFQILSVGRKTGTFVVTGAHGNAVIVFKNGLIVRAETSDLEKNLGQNLVDADIVKDTMYNMAVEVRKELPAKSIADILFEFGSVSKDTVEKIAKKRIERVIYKLLMWETGDFQFNPDDLSPEGKTDLPDYGWEISRGLSPEYLLMEGARVQDESTQIALPPEEEFSIEEPHEEGEGGQDSWDADWGSPVERKDISSLKSLTQELRFPNSASEITLLVLRFASDIFQRGVLFMVGKNEMVGLGQFGLNIDNPDLKVREMVLSTASSPFFSKVVMAQIFYKGALEKDEITEHLIREIGGGWPVNSAVIPIVAEGKAVGLLYCDNYPENDPISETEGLEIFINHAGLALEKSLLQRRIQEMERRKDPV